MKQLSVVSGQLTVVDVPPPMCGDNGVLVRVSHSLISTGTEMSMTGGGGDSLIRKALTNPDLVRKVWDKVTTVGVQQTAALIRARTQSSLALGYSAAGEVIDVGSAVRRFKRGDRVACAGAGYANHAEVDFVPENLVANVPDAVTFEEASFATLGAIALQGVRRLSPTLGEQFVVVGLGLIGQIAAQLLRVHGCRVFGADVMRARVDLARRLGMEAGLGEGEDLAAAVRAWTDTRMADGVVICASGGDAALLNRSFDLCRPKGRVVLVGDVPIRIARDKIYRKELDFLISCSYGPGRYDGRYEEGGLDYPIGYVRWTEGRNLSEILRLIGDRRLNVADLIGAAFPIDDAPAAYARLQQPDRPVAVLIDYAIDRREVTPLARAVRIAERAPAAGRVRLGVIGAGTFFKGVHLPNLQKNPGFEIRTLVSRTGLQLRDLAERYKIPRIATDPQDVFDDPDIDAVLIATRHDLHAEYTIRAVRAGKHVFVEKPLGLSTEQCEAAIAAAAEKGVLLAVGFNRRFSPHAGKLKKALGTVPGPRTVLYRINAGSLPSDHWLRDPAQGGGRIIGEGVHFFDFARWVVGADPIDVKAAALSSTAGVDPDNISAVVSFKGGSLASIIYTGEGHGSLGKERVEVFAGGAAFVLDDFKSLDVHAAGRTESTHTKAIEKGHYEILENFRAAVAGTAELQVTGLDGYWATWCAARASQSAVAGGA